MDCLYYDNKTQILIEGGIVINKPDKLFDINDNYITKLIQLNIAKTTTVNELKHFKRWSPILFL